MKTLILLALALAGAAQDAPRDGLPPSTPEARRVNAAYGRCVAERSPAMAARTLMRDFTTVTYQNGLRALSRNNESCFGPRRGRMRTHNLLFASAIAERLLSRDPAPLNARLARASMGPAAPAFSPSDAVAICLVRGVPDDVAALLATEVASEAETAAVRALAPAVRLCNGTDHALEATDAGLRAILATAAFRTLHNAAEARN